MNPPAKVILASVFALAGQLTAGAAAAQSARSSDVHVGQIGEQNLAEVRQATIGTHAARVIQNGDGNIADLSQDGPGEGTAAILQTGNGNRALANQTTLAAANSILVNQNGTGNRISLTQDGSDNSAVLNQEGDTNSMTVEQFGTNNALTWSQVGNGLSGPTVTMDGNRTLTIIQTGGQ